MTSWTVSNKLLLLIVLATAHASIGRGLGYAESLEGVLFSDESGQGPHRTGMIRLAVGDNVHELYYGEPVPKHFQSQLCWDIGVFWSVTFQLLADSTPDINSVSCTGRVDENAHGPWLVVRDYLRLVGNHSSSAYNLLSPRFRSSAGFQQVETRIRNDLDFPDYKLHGRPGRCIEIVKLERPDHAQLRTGDCYLGMDLFFSVVRNTRSNKWEIDEMKVD